MARSFFRSWTLLSLVVMLALGCKHPKGPPPGPPSVAFPPDTVDALTLSVPTKPDVKLVRRGDLWSVTSPPPESPAKAPKVIETVKGLTTMSFGPLVFADPSDDDINRLGVGRDVATHVVAQQAGKSLADIWIGKAGTFGTYVRDGATGAIWNASGVSSYLFSRSADELRGSSAEASISAAAQADQQAAVAQAQAAAKAHEQAVAAARAKVRPKYDGFDPDTTCTAKGLPPFRKDYGGGTLAEDQMVAQADGCQPLFPGRDDPMLAVTFCCPR